MKGISTFPLADFGHRQLYASLKHLIAFLVLGINTSPSRRKSVDPIRRKENMHFNPSGRASVESKQVMTAFVKNVFRSIGFIIKSRKSALIL